MMRKECCGGWLKVRALIIWNYIPIRNKFVL
jgi:hypothetical protein